MAEGIIEITDSNFEQEVINSDMPVLVDFWAAWCGPCKAIAPKIEELANEFAGKIKIGKCNVDENPSTPGDYEIRSIPTLIFIKDGKVVDKIIGIVSKIKLEEAIKNII